MEALAVHAVSEAAASYQPILSAIPSSGHNQVWQTESLDCMQALTAPLPVINTTGSWVEACSNCMAAADAVFVAGGSSSGGDSSQVQLLQRCQRLWPSPQALKADIKAAFMQTFLAAMPCGKVSTCTSFDEHEVFSTCCAVKWKQCNQMDLSIFRLYLPAFYLFNRCELNL